MEVTFARISAVKRNPIGRNIMKSSNQDKVQGTFHETKGKVKEMVGQITDNHKLEAKGKIEKIAGKAQEKFGRAKKMVGK